VGTFYTGAEFSLNQYNFVTWEGPLRGLEAAFNVFNLSLGLFLVFVARILGAQYLTNHIDHPQLNARTRWACLTNLIYALPFLLIILASFVVMDGYAVNPQSGEVVLEKGKYLNNLLQMPWLALMLVAGLVLVVFSVILTTFTESRQGIWFGGLGTVFVGLCTFLTVGYNHTAFYPSQADLQSSLTIANASSSHYTLTAMSYIALAVPVVLAYIIYVWRQMDQRKLTTEELQMEENY